MGNIICTNCKKNPHLIASLQFSKSQYNPNRLQRNIDDGRPIAKAGHDIYRQSDRMSPIDRTKTGIRHLVKSRLCFMLEDLWGSIPPYL